MYSFIGKIINNINDIQIPEHILELLLLKVGFEFFRDQNYTIYEL